MDPYIARMPARRERDLMFCEDAGLAYQAEMALGRAAYGDAYMAKFAEYDPQIEREVNMGRANFVARHAGELARVLDWGCGSGAFLRLAQASGMDCAGYEVIPAAAAWLKKEHVYAEDVSEFDALCLWDVLEHLEEPGRVIGRVRPGAMLFVSLPVFPQLKTIRASRHYRPGEHLYYFTANGLAAWLRRYGYWLAGTSDHEVRAGRDSIGAYAFERRTGAEPVHT